MRIAQGQPVVNRIGQPQRPQFLAPPTKHQDRGPVVLWLTKMILVHAHAALVHKLGGAHENILNHFGYIHERSVIDAIPLRNAAEREKLRR